MVINELEMKKPIGARKVVFAADNENIRIKHSQIERHRVLPDLDGNEPERLREIIQAQQRSFPVVEMPNNIIMVQAHQVVPVNGNSEIPVKKSNLRKIVIGPLEHPENMNENGFTTEPCVKNACIQAHQVIPVNGNPEIPVKKSNLIGPVEDLENADQNGYTTEASVQNVHTKSIATGDIPDAKPGKLIAEKSQSCYRNSLEKAFYDNADTLRMTHAPEESHSTAMKMRSSYNDPVNIEIPDIQCTPEEILSVLCEEPEKGVLAKTATAGKTEFVMIH